MKKLRVYYTKVENMGDLLNELIIEDLFGYEVVKSEGRFDIDTTGIGSGLNGLFPKKSQAEILPKRMLYSVYDKLTSPMQIWSTGFISYPTEVEIPLRQNINIACVRGELTKKRLAEITNRNLDNVHTADGGLLASELLKQKVPKKYAVGIIPHYKEINESYFKQLAGGYKNSLLINLADEPLKVIEQIASCECILSTSLHGLIVADSFGIPNTRLIFTDNLKGDGYKFNDYYSAFGIKEHKIIDLNKTHAPSIEEVINDYPITTKAVDQKKEGLVKSFSLYLNA